MGLILITIAFLALTLFANEKFMTSWHETFWSVMMTIGILGSLLSFTLIISMGITNRWNEHEYLKKYENIQYQTTLKINDFSQAYELKRRVNDINERLYCSKLIDDNSDFMVGIYKCKEFSHKPYIEFNWDPHE